MSRQRYFLRDLRQLIERVVVGEFIAELPNLTSFLLVEFSTTVLELLQFLDVELHLILKTSSFRHLALEIHSCRYLLLRLEDRLFVVFYAFFFGLLFEHVVMFGGDEVGTVNQRLLGWRAPLTTNREFLGLNKRVDGAMSEHVRLPLRPFRNGL